MFFISSYSPKGQLRYYWCPPPPNLHFGPFRAQGLVPHQSLTFGRPLREAFCNSLLLICKIKNMNSFQQQVHTPSSFPSYPRWHCIGDLYWGFGRDSFVWKNISGNFWTLLWVEIFESILLKRLLNNMVFHQQTFTTHCASLYSWEMEMGNYQAQKHLGFIFNKKKISKK